MGRLGGIILLYLIGWILPSPFVLASESEALLLSPPGTNEVHIAPNGISVPLGRILLVRKGMEYGALIITEAWIENREEDKYARYESYYQGDKTGDFSNKNVQVRKGKLSRPKGIWVGGGHWFSFRLRPEIRCGRIKLLWFYKTFVCFFGYGQAQGDYGIELAPTKWTDISEVNVFDPRLKWYRYDEERPRTRILIDQLWEDSGSKP